MSKRVTKFARDGIVKRAIAAAFDARFAALADEEGALARRAWEEIVSPAERAALAKTPPRFLRREDRIFVRHEGMRFYLLHCEPYPPATQDKNSYEISRDVLDRYQDLDARLSELKDERTRAKMAVAALVQSATTIGKLRDLWPEGEPFYATLEAAPVQLPAVTPARVNAMLGLAGTPVPEEAA